MKCKYLLNACIYTNKVGLTFPAILWDMIPLLATRASARVVLPWNIKIKASWNQII